MLDFTNEYLFLIVYDVCCVYRHEIINDCYAVFLGMRWRMMMKIFLSSWIKAVRLILMMREEKGAKPFIVKLGLALALSFAGFIYSRFRARRIKPNNTSPQGHPSGLFLPHVNILSLSFSPMFLWMMNLYFLYV